MQTIRLLTLGELAELPSSEKTRTYRILVVDDDLVLCAFNAEVLESAGFEVDIAEDGDAGWQALREKNYDLLVTDNNMPKVSGLELLQKVRSESLDIPVIMVSGAMPVDRLARQPDLQLDGTLSKPFTAEKLVGLVKQVLEESEGHRIPTRAGSECAAA